MIIKTDTALLMIEPRENDDPEAPKDIPIDDELTRMAEMVWSNCSPNSMFYRGVHTCVCGERSDNDDYITKKGRLTNSLMVHYVRNHRSAIPKDEIRKLKEEYSAI